MKLTKKNEITSSSHTRQAFLLTCKEGSRPIRFENFKNFETWRIRHKQAKVGDEIYLLKQGKGSRGIFGRGEVISAPYPLSEVVHDTWGWTVPRSGEDREKHMWVVDIRIDEITDPNKKFILALEDISQLHPPASLWHRQPSGVKIPESVAGAIRNSRQWKTTAISMLKVEARDTSETSYRAWVDARIGQQRFREKLLQYWGGCSVTGCLFYEVLVASHIVPWSGATNMERLDLHNGLLLTPNLDRLFDNYLISFNQRGEILISKSITSETMSQLGIYPAMKLQKIDSQHHHFLHQHENEFREKENSR